MTAARFLPDRQHAKGTFPRSICKFLDFSVGFPTDRGKHFCLTWSWSGVGGFPVKVIDLDSWETGYADGELGRATECPTGCDCHPLSYSVGYHAGRKARAGARRRAPQLRYARL